MSGVAERRVSRRFRRCCTSQTDPDSDSDQPRRGDRWFLDRQRLLTKATSFHVEPKWRTFGNTARICCSPRKKATTRTPGPGVSIDSLRKEVGDSGCPCLPPNQRVGPSPELGGFEVNHSQTRLGLPVRTAEKRPGVGHEGSTDRQSYGSPMCRVWDWENNTSSYLAASCRGALE